MADAVSLYSMADTNNDQLDAIYQLAKSVIKQAYNQTLDRHPSTAEVMNAFDRLADSGTIDRRAVAGKLAADVVKVLLGVARRNSDGRWLSNLYLYKKEQLHDDDSFCSQKTKKKVAHARDYTRLQLTASANGGVEGQSKESFFNRITPSHSPDKEDRVLNEQSFNDEEQLYSSQYDRINSEREINFQGSNDENPKDETPIAESKPILLKDSNNRLPTEFSDIGCRLNTSKNKSDLRSHLKLMSNSTDHCRPITKPPQYDRTASFDVIDKNPPILESGYTFYRIRLLSKAMYALQTTKAFAIRLRKFLELKSKRDRQLARTCIFALLKDNRQEVRSAWEKEKKAIDYWSKSALSESIYKWKFFYQIRRRQTMMKLVIEKRSRKRSLQTIFSHMRASFKYRVEIGRISDMLQMRIAVGRVNRAMIYYSQSIKDRMAHDRATKHCRARVFDMLRSGVCVSKINEASAYDAIVRQRRNVLVQNCYRGLADNRLRALDLYNLANKASQLKILRNSIVAWREYVSQMPNIPELSERQSTLVAKYLSLMNSEEGRRPSEIIGGRWSATSRISENDMAARIGITSDRNRLTEVSDSPFEDLPTSNRQPYIGAITFCSLKHVFKAWKDRKDYLISVKDSLRKSRLSRVWNHFIISIEKNKNLRDIERRIRIVKDSSAKEMAYFHWKEISQNNTKFKQDNAIALKYRRSSTLHLIFSSWRDTIVWELATERKVRKFEANTRKLLLRKSMNGLKTLADSAKSKKRFELFIQNTYIRSLLSKSMISLNTYKAYRQQKSALSRTYTAALATICKRRPLRAMHEAAFRNSSLRLMASRLEHVFKRQALSRMVYGMRVQDGKVKHMRLYGKDRVMKRSVFVAWRARVGLVRHQRERVEEMRVGSGFTSARPYFEIWLSKARVILEANERDNAASDFYDIKILVSF